MRLLQMRPAQRGQRGAAEGVDMTRREHHFMQLRSWRIAALLLAVSASCVDGEESLEEVVADADGTGERWFVQFEGAPTARGGQKSALADKAVAFRQEVRRAGLLVTEQQRYELLWNGVAVVVARGDVKELRALPGVKAVYPVRDIPAPVVKLADAPAPALGTSVGMIGADVARSELGLTGAGVRVGIIDSGIDYHHPSLGGCFGPGCRVAFGWDLVGDAFTNTGGSLPVPDADPDTACSGHGSHVAGIVGASGAITGVAPGVTFGAYRVFGCTGSTNDAVLLEALERAAADGVDIINMSLGSPFGWPEDPVVAAASALTDMGITVVVSAGNNNGLGVFAVGSFAAGDETIATASVENSHLSALAIQISAHPAPLGAVRGGAEAPIPPDGSSAPMAKTSPTQSDADACQALPAGSLTGRIALIRRGGCTFTVKVANAQTAGAVGVLLFNNAPGAIVAGLAGPPAITVPVSMVSNTDGALIAGLIDAAPVDQPVTMTWTHTPLSIPNPSGGLLVLGTTGSSSGPTAKLGFKPNLAAPGGGINSTFPLEMGGAATIGGTSMASPHAAGAAALLIQARPGISPREIRALLQNTAVPVPAPLALNLGDARDATLRQGAGLIRVDIAARATGMATPSQLALGETDPTAPVTRTLTIENLGDAAVTYTPSHLPTLSTTGTWTPAFSLTATAAVSFSAPTVTVEPGAEATLDVTFTAPAALADLGIYGGYVVLTPDAGSTLRIPYMALKGDYQTLPVATPTASGFPWLARPSGTTFTRVDAGTVFTLEGTDRPAVLVHFDHLARRVQLDVTDERGKRWGRWVDDELLSKNNTPTGAFNFQWDGTTILDRRRVVVPNGRYLFKLSILKPLGDEGNPAHWETWTSPVFVLRHR
jgi:minor extracellular serine protease Vpr